MVGPVVHYLEVLGEEELANTITVPKYVGTQTEIGTQTINIEDGQKVYMIETTNIIGPASKSLELINTLADYQTTKAAKVILIITGLVTEITDCEVIEDSAANAGTGTVKEDFPLTEIPDNASVTTQVLDFAAGKYITLKITTGRGNVEGFVIE